METGLFVCLNLERNGKMPGLNLSSKTERVWDGEPRSADSNQGRMSL